MEPIKSNEESNLLIAEFMGVPTVVSKSGHLYVDNENIEEPTLIRYHNSWDWLMPVVEKVEGMEHEGFSIIVNISGAGAYIGINRSNAGGNKYEGKTEIANTLNINYFINHPEPQFTKIQGVYEAVVQFITWFNTNPIKS